MEPFLVGLGLMAAVGLFMAGTALLMIAHRWPPTFTITLDSDRQRDDADDWKYR